MSTFRFSSLLWIVGAVVGAAVSPRHRWAGAGIGAILTGALGDKMIERAQARRVAIRNTITN